MQHIKEHNRWQMELTSLDTFIAHDNPVRVIDAFADQLELDKLGFVANQIKSEGRPSYQSKLFLKIYLYGYVNGIRSSRKLERECMRNIEMQWLCGRLVPNYHTIADFRKVNHHALRNMFKLFVAFLKDEQLIAGEIIAIDGTKSRAHNSKKNNYNPKKIDRHLNYIEDKSNQYLNMLDANDAAQTTDLTIPDIKTKLQQLKERKIKYELIARQLQQSNQPQVSTTDADARALLVQGQVVEVCYNTQAAVDAKHKLVVATHTINRNDRNAMSAIALEAKHNLETHTLTALLDKGYHNGREIQTCKDNNITTICAQQEIVNSNEKGTTPEYLVTKFIYNETDDTYTCPQGETLQTKGTWHYKQRTERSTGYRFKKYRTPQCKTCPVKNLCTGKAKGGREIERSEFAKAVEENAARYHTNKELYRTRQEINEHIFGTIKRVWGYYYTNLKGLQKVNGEWSLIMLCYNLKRCINILGIPTLLEKLKNYKPDYGKIAGLHKNTKQFKLITRIVFLEHKLAA